MARRKAISPVIATVIIVAVTIAVAIAVAFWMTGIIGLFTGFEQLQIVSIFDNSTGIYVTVKNTGTSTASIVDVYVNGKPCVQLGACDVYDATKSEEEKPEKLSTQKSFALRSGDTIILNITNINQNIVGKVGPGVSVEVKLLTASGKEYPKLIVLQQYTPPQSGGGGKQSGS
ncbi:MAG: archaellin/type IV pilin N-terminal domain-containing protein [Desulfurococcaceae archaeon]